MLNICSGETISRSNRIMLVDGLRTMGGEERIVVNLAAGLINRGFEVAIVCNSEGDMVSEARDTGALISHIDLNGKSSWKAPLQIRRHVQRWKPDVLHVHGSYSSIHGRIAAIGTGVPTVWTIQLHPRWYNPNMSKFPLHKAITVAVMRAFDRITTETVFVGHGLANDTITFVGCAPKQWSVVCNGIDTDRYRPSSKQRWRFRHDIGIDLDVPLVGIIAALSPRKGVDTFLQAVKLLENHKIFGVIAGDGPARGKLENMAVTLGIQNQIKFLGKLSSTESFVAGIDVGVLPSRGEGLPLCVMEMLSAGVPVVLSDILNHDDFKVASPAVKFATTNNFGSFASAIEKMLQTSETLEVKKLARTAAKINFSKDSMVESYVKVYRRVLAKHGANVR